MTTPSLIGGLLVAVEGIDGAGKTTVARAITEELRSAGATVVLSKEPTNGQWGSQLRESAHTGRLPPEREAELLVLDRREHLKLIVGPALAAGQIVILDRYFPSMVAYQGAAGLPTEELLRANDFAPRPDLLLLLDLPTDVGLGRIRARGDAPNSFETDDNLTRCREIFQALELPGKQVIDASLSLEDVIDQAAKAVLHALSSKALAQHMDPLVAFEVLSSALPAIHPAE